MNEKNNQIKEKKPRYERHIRFWELAVDVAFCTLILLFVGGLVFAIYLGNFFMFLSISFLVFFWWLFSFFIPRKLKKLYEKEKGEMKEK